MGKDKTVYSVDGEDITELPTILQELSKNWKQKSSADLLVNLDSDLLDGTGKSLIATFASRNQELLLVMEIAVVLLFVKLLDDGSSLEELPVVVLIVLWDVQISTQESLPTDLGLAKMLVFNL